MIRRWRGLAVGGTAAAVCVQAGPAAGAAFLAGAEPTFRVHAADVAGAVLVVIAAVAAVTGRAAPPPRRALVAFGPLIAAAGLATLCSQDIAASLPGFVRVLELFVLVPLAVLVLVRDRRDALLATWAIVGTALVQSGIGIWQALTENGAAIAGRTVRAVGTFGADDVMALSIVAGFGVVLTLAFALAGPGRLRPIALAALIPPALALVLALSRGSWIAIAAATTLVLVAYSRRLALKTAVTCAAVLVVAVGGCGVGGLDTGSGSDTLAMRAQSMANLTDAPDQSVVDRLSLWTAATGMWGDHPITGVGVKNFPAYRDTYAPIELSAAGDVADPANGYRRQPLLSPHNQYLLFLSEQGLVGLLALMGLFLTLLYGLCTRLAPRDPLWLASAGFLTGLLVNFMYADISGPSGVLIAIMLGLAAAGPSYWRRGEPA